MQDLGHEQIHTAIEAYRERAPFAAVEDDRLETLPAAFADGSYLWKDLEWIVRWYCRRPLDGQIHPAEHEFRENSMDEIRGAIEAAHTDDGISARVSALTRLSGVDVPIASAFLQFMDPTGFTAIDERAWTVLQAGDRLHGSYPDPPDAGDYETFLAACRELADIAGVPVVDVGRALWWLGSPELARPSE